MSLVLATVGFDYELRLRYEMLRSLLRRNGLALQLMADLEADLNHLARSDSRLRRPLQRLLDEVLLMAQELNFISGDRHVDLYDAIERVSTRIAVARVGEARPSRQPLAVAMEDREFSDSSLVGGKASGVRALRTIAPDHTVGGFAITTAGYRLFIEQNDLGDRIRLMLDNIEVVADPLRFGQRTQAIRKMIESAPLPGALQEAIASHAAEQAGVGPTGWAVRSSSVSEDGAFSFAGQLDTFLNVSPEALAGAYRKVLAGRFSDRAVRYRLNCGLNESDTPMAVLFMPMVDAQAAGVVYTSDPLDLQSGVMVVSAAPGLGDRVVRGSAEADLFHLSREASPRLLDARPARTDDRPPDWRDYLPEKALLDLGVLAYQTSIASGCNMDLEWAMDRAGKLWLLQGRRLRARSPQAVVSESDQHNKASLLEGGATIFPGRAEGMVARIEPGTRPTLPEGAVLVVEQVTPALAEHLPSISALLAAGGSPVGHLATLLREFAVPSIFQIGPSARVLCPGTVVSVDATKRAVYQGSRWPDVRERVLLRLGSRARNVALDPLHAAVLSLHLVDPFARAFDVKHCLSAHDIIRFIHEMAVRSTFKFGDERKRSKRTCARQLESELPLRARLIDLDACTPDGKGKVAPESVRSAPFQAFWKGLADPRLAWPDRWGREVDGLPVDFQEAVLGGARGTRRRGEPNYMIAARDYFNFNARFAYHYAMVDALVGPGGQNNYVHFRFHNGGASNEKRERRALFLERVLRESRFGVDRRGDLVTAWMRRYSQKESETALTMLGRLLVCSRQLDLLMTNEDNAKLYAQYFLGGDYQAFR